MNTGYTHCTRYGEHKDRIAAMKPGESVVVRRGHANSLWKASKQMGRRCSINQLRTNEGPMARFTVYV